jgi:hypothetical protein
MASPGNALQKGLYDRLIGYSALTTALGGNKVYDHVPQETDAPYVIIGADTLLDASSKSNNKWEATVTIHAWDFEKAGRKSVKTLLSNLYDALHQQESNITLTGFTLVQIRFDFEETYQETAVEGANDHYYHGVQRYRAFIQA